MRGPETARAIGRAPAADGSFAAFYREGEYWTIAYAGTVCRVRNAKGLHCLAPLLRNPGERFGALELLALTQAPKPSRPQARIADVEGARVLITKRIRAAVKKSKSIIHHSAITSGPASRPAPPASISPILSAQSCGQHEQLRTLVSGGVWEQEEDDMPMDDLELLRMAMFKLREAANRLLTLGAAARSARLRRQLAVVHRHLAGREAKLASFLQVVGQPRSNTISRGSAGPGLESGRTGVNLSTFQI